MTVAMKTKILFVGAGAIGRGYLPSALDEDRHEFIFIDTNQAIVDRMNTRGEYTTYRVTPAGYKKKPSSSVRLTHPTHFACKTIMTRLPAFSQSAHATSRKQRRSSKAPLLR